MSQTRIKSRIPAMEAVEFSQETWTDRGERVYKCLRIMVQPQFGASITRVLQCDKQLGITEEWIEDTLVGCFDALAVDYPGDDFKLIVHRPNDVSIVYAGPKGMKGWVN